ncbi:MAG TPA: type II CAAX endopeptidase family protein [Ruminiclostridium sp.]|nr:type II CAAX endopeptidase family protein [Ruminiclostridium sp.]
MDNSKPAVPENILVQKKAIKRLSNTFSLALILEQFVGVLALIFGAILIFLLRFGVFHQSSHVSFQKMFDFLSQSDNNDAIGSFFNLICYFTYMFVTFVIIAAILRQNPFKVIPFKFKKVKFLPILLVFGLLVSIIGEQYSSFSDALLNFFNLKVNLEQFNFPTNPTALVFYVLSVSVFAPFCEEFIFRGLIMQNLRKYGDFFAVIVTALMFGVLHGNFEQTPFAFVVGIALGFTVLETGSVFAGIILHCLINSTSVIFGAISTYAGDNLANVIYLIYIAVIVALSVVSVILLKKRGYLKRAYKKYLEKPSRPQKAFIMYSLTPGFIIFASFYFLTCLISLTHR